MDIDLNDAALQRIAQMINSDSSPVGIDAKKTHVLIIHKLNQIEARLAALEARGEAEETCSDRD